MSKDYVITYSCHVSVWSKRTPIDNMLEDLLFGQTFRVTSKRLQVVHLTSTSYRSRVRVKKRDRDRVWFTVRVPCRQFADHSISSVLTQLWGNILDYPGIRLESIDRRLVEACMGTASHSWKHDYLRQGRGPLLGTVLKPTWGLSTAEKIDIACRFVEMGGDVIKEDETCFLTADQLIREQGSIQTALDAVSSRYRGTGIYVPNITGVIHNSDAVQCLTENGMTLALVNFLVCGMGCVQHLTGLASSELLIWGHRVGYASMADSMGMYALAQLAVVIGLAVVHIGTPSMASGEAIARTSRIVRMLAEAEEHGGRGVWPVFTKTTANTVPALIARFGRDIILLACGELRAGKHGNICDARTQRWIDAAKG